MNPLDSSNLPSYIAQPIGVAWISSWTTESLLGKHLLKRLELWNWELPSCQSLFWYNSWPSEPSTYLIHWGIHYNTLKALFTRLQPGPSFTFSPIKYEYYEVHFAIPQDFSCILTNMVAFFLPCECPDLTLNTSNCKPVLKKTTKSMRKLNAGASMGTHLLTLYHG